jgi:hypothetical protein
MHTEFVFDKGLIGVKNLSIIRLILFFLHQNKKNIYKISKTTDKQIIFNYFYLYHLDYYFDDFGDTLS